ncbi:hypothetical protein HG530_010973 [Fusarium avenaceum]|nr:hypothetical protein HG530_010973 [Fusarium avenaceum]
MAGSTDELLICIVDYVCEVFGRPRYKVIDTDRVENAIVGAMGKINGLAAKFPCILDGICKNVEKPHAEERGR